MVKKLSFHLFFLNDTATTEIYTLSLHDALPICELGLAYLSATTLTPRTAPPDTNFLPLVPGTKDRKSTRLNSSHPSISYAVFCLKKKKTKYTSPDNHYFQVAPSDVARLRALLNI